MLTRRELIELVARAAAAPAAAEFFSVWLEAAPRRQHSGRLDAPAEPPLLRDYQPTFFAADDFEALQAFTGILIPTDDTPGAREARCAHFIDFLMHASSEHAPQAQRQWRQAMQALRAAGFHGADEDKRAALVDEMSRPERDRGASHPAYFAYRLIKQQNTFAFYTSRAGTIDTLDYRGNSYNASFPACEHAEHR